MRNSLMRSLSISRTPSSAAIGPPRAMMNVSHGREMSSSAVQET